MLGLVLILRNIRNYIIYYFGFDSTFSIIGKKFKIFFL